ncbi:MAG: 50S ribosomal protein L15 [Elusimicrobia bacterium]|nr:50S ribosomal protein L15 [Elusimicrobiota bacterium]
MSLNTLKPQRGAKKRKRIIGRGQGSGMGGTATRGMKGQKSRSGDGKMAGFEGGQSPLIRRMPKRGVGSMFRKEYDIVSLSVLEKNFDKGAEITCESLKKAGVVKRGLPVKILGTGEISKALNISVQAYSKSAAEKIVKAGGKAEIVKCTCSKSKAKAAKQ